MRAALATLLGLFCWSQALAWFPAPVPTPYWCDYLGSFTIGDLPAQPGDEIAFFDPSGVICGRYVVPVGVEGRYGVVHLYGDDPQSAAIDEGCSEGDVLDIRIWRALDQREFAMGELTLNRSTLSGFLPAPNPPAWSAQGSFALNVAGATAYFASPTYTPSIANVIGDLQIGLLPAEIGDELGLFDQSGVVVGRFRVLTPGQYGVVQLYGDDPLSGVDEGAVEGEQLRLSLWDASAGVEYDHLHIEQASGAQVGSFTAAVTPLAWSEGLSQVLNLSAVTLDIDGDGFVTEPVDGVLVQRYLFGFRGDSLIDGLVIGGVRSDAPSLEAFLSSLMQVIEIDSNTRADALTDGLLLRRYLVGGYTPSTLIAGARGLGSQRDAQQINDYLVGVAH